MNPLEADLLALLRKARDDTGGLGLTLTEIFSRLDSEWLEVRCGLASLIKRGLVYIATFEMCVFYRAI